MACPVQALIPDPVEAGLLAKIAASLQAIEQFRMRVMAQIQAQISTRINAYAFPNRLFDPIRSDPGHGHRSPRHPERAATDGLRMAHVGADTEPERPLLGADRFCRGEA